MNYKFTFLILFIFISSTLNAQDVPEEQKSLITKVTATWCFNCGTWGWNLFEGLVEDNSEKALVIANHYSGDLANPTSDTIAENFNILGQPRFILNNEDQGASSNTIENKRTEINENVEANFSLSPLANSGITATINDNLLNVTTKTRFFQPTMGEYYLAVYIIEDEVINNQSGQGMNAVHKNVLRAGMTDNTFGNLIMNGSINMGMEFNHEFSIELNDTWNLEKLTVATIIWEKDGDNYLFINTNYTSEFDTPTSVNEIAPTNLEATVYPNLIHTKEVSKLHLKPAIPLQNVKIALFNIQGQLIQNIFNGDLSLGEQIFLIDPIKEKGLFFVKIIHNGKVLTRKIIQQ